MTSFIEDLRGRLWNLAEIQSIGPRLSRRGAVADPMKIWAVEATSRDGRGFSIAESDLDDLLRSPVHVWPAQPGCFIVHVFVDGPEAETATTTILAWALGRDGVVYPITADGVNDGMTQSMLVMTPDGEVTDPGNRSWTTLEACVAERGAAEANRRARREQGIAE